MEAINTIDAKTQEILYPNARKMEDPPVPVDYVTAHKHAFRVAFDTLKELYPPKDDADYWQFASRRMAVKQHENKNNPLCTELLMAVYAYMEKLIQKEREPTNEQCSNAIDAGMDRG